MALPRRRALPLYLRRRISTLLLAATRISRHSAGELYDRRHPPRVLYRKILRPTLHRLMRASGIGSRRMARAATATTDSRVSQRVSAHQIATSTWHLALRSTLPDTDSGLANG